MQFVAGDVRRLSRTPSGTVDIVLEKVLQEEYKLDPGLAPDQAKRDIESLSAILSSDPKTTAATLSAVPGNQRILAILAALNGSSTPRIQRAIAAAADQALAESSASNRDLGREFNPAADSVSTLLYGGFSPAKTLQATYDLAQTTRSFGQARDALWQAASHESVFDTSSAVTEDVADLEHTVQTGLDALKADTMQAIADHQDVAHVCPDGPTCQASKDAAQAHGARARQTIAEQQEIVSKAAGLLEIIDTNYGTAIQAESQAAAQVASTVNSYFARTDYEQYAHATADVIALVAQLSISEIDPAAAINGALNVVHDFIDIGEPKPDANALILRGLQGVSQQLAAFAQETAIQFRAVDTRLETISRQVSALASQLSTQLAEAQTQLRGLGDALGDLQASVDRLHSEIQQLFAATAVNALRTLTTESVGFQHINHRLLEPDAFARYAAALFDNATAISSSEPLLPAPLSWDARGAAAITNIDPSINFFALFPQRVTDSPVAWPALTTDCLTGRCLPSPDYWAGASRSYAQLLLENRGSVTPGHLTWLRNAIAAGSPIDRALRKISDNDDGNTGTGSKLFNASLGYYDAKVDDLLETIRAQRESYLGTQRPSGVKPDTGWVDPWGGDKQALGDVDLLGVPSLQRLPSDHGNTIPDLRPLPELVTRLPIAVQNAIRLGIGNLDVSWTATWNGPPGGSGLLNVTMYFRYHVDASGTRPAIDDNLGFVRASHAFTGLCDEGSADPERTFIAGWTGKTGCRNWPAEFRYAIGAGPNTGADVSHDDSGFAKTSSDLTPLVSARLLELQHDSTAALVRDGTKLTHGDGTRATEVDTAATRVQGADTVLRGYVSLGLPQALATDDGLRGLLSGDDADALLHPRNDARTTAFAAAVPDQLVNLINFQLQNGIPESDPLIELRTLFFRHHLGFANEIGTYVKTGRAVGQNAADGGKLDEGNPLVTSTLDRLALTRAVLEDHLAHPAAHGTPATPAVPNTPAGPPAQSTPVKPAAKPAPARARLIRRPTAKGNAIRFTIACLSGTCRITTTVKAGRKAVAHPLTLKAGKRRTVTIRVKRRQTVTVTIKLAGTARPLVTKRLRLR